MNFFERQDEARRNSRLLSWLFAAAVLAIVVAVDSVASVTWVAWRAWENAHFRHGLGHVPASFHVTVAAITLLLILVVSSVKSMQLRAGGGAAVARMLGGRPIGRGTADAFEKRLLNVVEEMAIASGTRVPLVFVLDRQKGINAFTAGHDVSHAAIAVTRGAIETLTRDELQGVIAHEFSHIVNGDTALNIRMVGLLSGIVWIGALGHFAMRAASRAKDVRATPVAVVGFCVWVIGSVGLVCSRAIKAMLSRERELLADASGVQFTRHPEGLAGALDQIRAAYSWVASPHTENVSHLFFADAHGYLSGLFFATHPPIDERIRRIAPRFSAESYRRTRSTAFSDAAAAPPRPFDEVVASSQANAIPWRLTATDAVALVGSVQAPHLEDAREGLRALAPELRMALDDRRGAGGVVIALLLARQGDAGEAGLRALGQGKLVEVARAVKDALPLARAVPPERELAVVDLALPVLRIMSPGDRMQLLEALHSVVAAEEKVSIHAFAIATFVRSQLERRSPTPPSQYRTLAKSRDDAAVLISLVAHAGCGEPQDERGFVRAFEAGCIESGLMGQVAAVRRDQCTPESASRALSSLRDLAPLEKARLVKGLFAAITADGVIRPIEAALMRMVGGVLDCPLPPLMLGAAIPAPVETAAA